MQDHQDVNTRLSRLETLVDNINNVLSKIQNKLDESSKVNWAPIAIGVTIFFTIAGSIATIYNARISTLNTAVEHIAARTLDVEKSSVEQTLKTQILQERVDRLEKDYERVDQDNRNNSR